MPAEHHPGRLLASLLICLIPGYAGLYLFTTSIPGWYSGLVKPDILPPDNLFFYAIIAVFGLLGLALYTIWNAGFSNHEVQTAATLFFFTLILLVFWFWVFFSLHAVYLALVVMLLVVAAAICTIAQALMSSVGAVFFLVPCLILLVIACYANYLLVVLNPDLPIWGNLL